MSELDTWTVESEAGQREWQAEDVDHALEQHRDAFPDEAVYGVWLGHPRNETLADAWTANGEPLPGTDHHAALCRSRITGENESRCNCR